VERYGRQPAQSARHNGDGQQPLPLVGQQAPEPSKKPRKQPFNASPGIQCRGYLAAKNIAFQV
jgi:hypothetical protein